MFLDLIAGEKLYDSIMNNPKIKRKFWGFFWRGALMTAGSIAAVFLLVFALAALMQGSMTLSFPMFLVLAIALLVLSVTAPIVSFFLWNSGKKKKHP